MALFYKNNEGERLLIDYFWTRLVLTPAALQYPLYVPKSSGRGSSCNKMAGIVVISSCGHLQIILLTKRCGKRNTSRPRITRMHQTQPTGKKKYEQGKYETYSDWSDS
jgi:hypothetical protein